MSPERNPDGFVANAMPFLLGAMYFGLMGWVAAVAGGVQ